jgi:tetratricopeptide (TPR) repeat protein
MEAGDAAAAERATRGLVQVNPRDHAAWHVLAVLALRSERAELAVELAERAHRLERKNAAYLNTLGVAHGDSGRADEAIAALQRALKLRPAFADGHYNLGKVLDRGERFAEARDAYRRALAIDPRHASAAHNLAAVLLELGESEEALALARAAHEQAPADLDRRLCLAAALRGARGDPEASAFVERCIEAGPDEPWLHAWLGESLLRSGNWERGWREYLWRPSTMGRPSLPLAPLPADAGAGAIALVPDQGLGDTLFFLRFAARLIEQAGDVILRTPPKLAGVLAGRTALGPLAIAPEAGEPGIAVRATVLLGDLPYVVGAREVVPPVTLAPRAELVQRWRAALAALGPAPYVGLTWRGGTDRRAASEFGMAHRASLFKEADLRSIAAAVRGFPATLVAIQRHPAAGEIDKLAALAGQPVHDLCAANDDLEDMTALLALLDDYVGVSNTNMHLRVGLGLAAKVLVPNPPEFRWMAAGDRSPWFPGFGVYRQRPDGGWHDAAERLRADLASTAR